MFYCTCTHHTTFTSHPLSGPPSPSISFICSFLSIGSLSWVKPELSLALGYNFWVTISGILQWYLKTSFCAHILNSDDDVILPVQSIADPRFKLTPFDGDRLSRKVVDATVAVMERVHASTSCAVDLSAEYFASQNDGQTLPTPADASIPPSLLYDQQLSAYTSEPTVADTACPLSWWATNRHRYPLVAAAAQSLLVIPAAAVSTERLFTKKGDAVMDSRDTLSTEKDETVLFIMDNLWTSHDSCVTGSDARIVFFHFESNSWAIIFEISNRTEYLSLVSKVTSSRYLLNKFNCFYGTALLWFTL